MTQTSFFMAELFFIGCQTTFSLYRKSNINKPEFYAARTCDLWYLVGSNYVSTVRKKHPSIIVMPIGKRWQAMSGSFLWARCLENGKLEEYIAFRKANYMLSRILKASKKETSVFPSLKHANSKSLKKSVREKMKHERKCLQVKTRQREGCLVYLMVACIQVAGQQTTWLAFLWKALKCPRGIPKARRNLPFSLESSIFSILEARMRMGLRGESAVRSKSRCCLSQGCR